MKTIGKLKQLVSVIFLCFLLFFFAPGALNYFLFAQDLMPKLTYSEIKSVIPILKEEIKEYGQIEKSQEMKQSASLELFNDIKSGKTDPLEWLKQRSKYIIVPPGAVYEPACSRAVSIKGWDMDPEVKGSAVPTAIFTFGQDNSAINKNLLGKEITKESYNRFRENLFNINDPNYSELKSILEKTRSFYSEREFSTQYSLIGYAVEFFPFEAEGEISGIIWQIQTDLFDPSYPDVVKNCGSHPMGPSIEIRAGDSLMDKFYQPIERKEGADNNTIKEKLIKAGITENQYSEIKSALIIARMDSQNSEEPEPPAVNFTPTSPEEKETAELLSMMRENALIKKNNVMLYNKYKVELDPILDILQNYMGGQY